MSAASEKRLALKHAREQRGQDDQGSDPQREIAQAVVLCCKFREDIW